MPSKWLSFCLLIVSSLALGDNLSLRERAYQFVEKNLVGKTQVLSTEGNVSTDGEEYLVQFNATISWGNLEKTDEGLVFEETRDIKQTNTKLDASGKPTSQIVKTDRVVVHRYAVSERQTTNSLVGITTVTKNTLEDPTGRAFATMIELSPDNKELYLYTSLVGFVENSLDGKNLIPVSFAADATFFVDKSGKLRTNETLKFYKVNVNKDFAKEEVYRFNLSASESR